MAPPAFQLQASIGPVQMQDQGDGDWIPDMEGGKAMFYKTRREAEVRMATLEAQGKYKAYKVEYYQNGLGWHYRVVMTNNPPAQQQVVGDEWTRDMEGDTAMFYNSKAEAETRMAKLQARDGSLSYKVEAFQMSKGRRWRVMMKRGGATDNSGAANSGVGQVVGDEWTKDMNGNIALFYLKKEEAEDRMNDLQALDSSLSYKVERFKMSKGFRWRVMMRQGGGETSATVETPAEEAPVAETPVVETPVEEAPVAETVTEPATEAPAAASTSTTEDASPYKLGLTDSVGEKQTNNDADVAKVREKLVSYGFLAADKTDQASLNAAIGEFQKDVLGMETPDKQISAGGRTDRALTTYYTAKVTDYCDVESNLKDITVTKVTASADFKTEMASATFNGSTTVDNVDVKAMIALQDRIIQIRSASFGNSFSNAKLKAIKDKAKADYTDADKKLVKSHIASTITGIKSIQGNKHIDWWATKKHNDDSSHYVLTQSKTKPAYKYGTCAPNDATHLYLRDFEKQTLSWEQGGKTKSRTEENFVYSKHTSYTNGISDGGTERAKGFSVDRFKDAADLDTSRAKALRHVSQHEGGFDGINTFDRAIVSYGFIQFAGGGRSLEELFARIKQNHPTVWQDNFAKYGIDVEYKTNSSGKIDKRSCRLVVHDPDDEKTYRGNEATHAIRNNPKFIGVLQRAGANADVQDEQIAFANDKYIKGAENTDMGNWYQMKMLLVKDAEGAVTTVKVDLKRKDYVKGKYTWRSKRNEIAAFKKTADYTTANTAGLVTELDFSDEFDDLTYGAIMQSDKERAALYGTYLHGPARSRYAFGDALVAIIEEDRLSTVAQIKAISPKKLLNKAVTKMGNKNDKKRIRNARDDKSLGS